MSAPTPTMKCTAFSGPSAIASGDCATVAAAVKHALDTDPTALILVFNDTTAEQVEFDLRGSVDDVVSRLPRAEEPTGGDAPGGGAAESPTPRPPGRPRLGVVAREVTLLPRHWEWLRSQRGGASATLRRLVEDARRANADVDAVRTARDATYRFMSTIAGNERGYEEATRALYAGDRARFEEQTASWPKDVRQYASRLAEGTWAPRP